MTKSNLKNRVVPSARWTDEEHELLRQAVLTEPSRPKAFTIVSEKTKRTVVAVKGYYHAKIKHELNLNVKFKAKTSTETDIKFPSVKYHNGVTKNAIIILKRKDLIVAKVDDIVITVEL